MRKLIEEFKTFLTRGNVMDMAVGVMIGAAFKAIVDSLVNDVISPLIGLVADTNFSDLALSIGGVTVGYGAFFTAVINFFIMAAVLFLMLKFINSLRAIGDRLAKPAVPEPPAPAPKTKLCPYCLAEIPAAATRCGHCTSVLEGSAPQSVSR